MLRNLSFFSKYDSFYIGKLHGLTIFSKYHFTGSVGEKQDVYVCGGGWVRMEMPRAVRRTQHFRQKVTGWLRPEW